MLELRPYQLEAVEAVFQWFVDHPTGNPLIALPTGTGKSVVIAEIIRRAISRYPETRFMIATHRQELISQNFNELVGLWPSCPCGIYSAGLKRRDTQFPVTFAGIASVVSRVKDFGFIHLLIVDEAQMISHKTGTMYQKAIWELKQINPQLRVIGLSATPFRLGLGMLTEGDLFTDISTDYCSLEKFNLLVDQGYISPLIPKKTDGELLVDGVHIRQGEFVAEELQAAVDKEELTRKVLAEAKVSAHDRNHWLVFCAGIKHAEHACQYLNELGIPAVCVHTDLPDPDVARINLERKGLPAVGRTSREMHFNAFTCGAARALVGVDVFSVGFNFKPVDCILWLRPTMSPVLWVQGCGRGTRPSPETGKRNCLVLDFSRNTVRCGPVNDPVLPRKPGESKGSGMVPFKLCPECNTYNHTRALTCVDCEFEFPINSKQLSKTASKEELIRKEPKVKEPKPPKPPKPELPAVIESYNVDRVEFSKHQSRDREKPPSLKVHYYSQNRIFSEYICLEHKGFASHKAREKWRLMAGYEDKAPNTIDEALSRIGTLRLPTEIRVMHGKFDEVVGYEFGQRALVEENPF